MLALIAALALVAAYPLSTPRQAHASGVVVNDLNHGVTPADMANALVGGGVSISNVHYTGANRAAGKFSGGATSIGFDNGIILDSGAVQTYSTDPACSQGVEGPNTCHENPPSSHGTANSTDFGNPGDADLKALSGFATFDASILEFDFVPQQSTIQFQYVFSSEEYSDYSNTQFNDVFGFFVGTGTTKKNCAVVPGTSLPVSINTINNGNDLTGGDATPHNAAYFRDNVRPTPGTIDSQMDGLTLVLNCNATVTPNQANHLKLAIADASDGILDSAVFIKGGSLVSGTVITTSLKGGGQSGAAITVPQGTQVTDSATLTGANASTAGGTVTYTVYNDATCQPTGIFASGGTKTVVKGVVPDSDAVTMTQPGTFHWIAAYSGDPTTGNNASSSVCSDETVIVTQVDQPISAAGTTINAIEGTQFSGTVATFTDPDLTATAAEYSATINWGDGTPTSAGVITGANGSFTVTGSHMYAEEGKYPVTVTITDVDNPSNTATANSTALVADAALTSACAMPPFTAQTYSGPTATFSDKSSTGTLSDFSATINWGDGSSAGTIAGGPGNVPYTVSGSHTYGSTGTFTVTTTVTDVGGSKTTATCSVTVFAFATGNGAAFVIGDLEAPPAAPIGNHVYFWGSQWWTMNPMTMGPAPASMKGFAGFEDNPLGVPPACGKGQQWTTDTGNATPPPQTIPAVMAILVSSKIVQNGSVISGDIKEIVIVKTDPGYAPNPGSPGTGTILGVLCITP
jgi:hypothetical protein